MRLERSLEPVEALVALQHVERAVDVVGFAPKERLGVGPVAGSPSWLSMYWSTISVNRPANCFESLMERENATARPIGSHVLPEVRLGPASLGQAVPAADDLRCVVEAELAVLVGQLRLEGVADGLLVHREHEDFVVGEQAVADGLTEAEPVQLRP